MGFKHYLQEKMWAKLSFARIRDSHFSSIQTIKIITFVRRSTIEVLSLDPSITKFADIEVTKHYLVKFVVPPA